MAAAIFVFQKERQRVTTKDGWMILNSNLEK